MTGSLSELVILACLVICTWFTISGVNALREIAKQLRRIANRRDYD